MKIGLIDVDGHNFPNLPLMKLSAYHKSIGDSVDRVLDFIRSEYRQGRLCDLEILLCHCQNKLNGNIDGTELTLDKGKPFEILKVGDTE